MNYLVTLGQVQIEVEAINKKDAEEGFFAYLKSLIREGKEGAKDIEIDRI